MTCGTGPASPFDQIPLEVSHGTASRNQSREASKFVKRFAEEQQITVELTEEQYQAILGTWNEQDPKRPARISFQVKDRTVAAIDVAGYRYRGSTCCV